MEVIVGRGDVLEMAHWSENVTVPFLFVVVFCARSRRISFFFLLFSLFACVTNMLMPVYVHGGLLCSPFIWHS